ncbi:hypothetical protein H1R20_g9747, partial [Candolleomyces eurysporus]
MASSSSASSSSASSSRDSSSPEPPKTKVKSLKRKAQQAQNDSECDDSDSDSDLDSSQTAENDEPPLSHAERRKQKKKAQKLKAAAEDPSSSSSKKRKLKDGSAVATGSKKDVPVKTPRQNSVWVGNLSFKTTQENLRTFFESAGEVTRINMPMKPASRPNLPRENKGFAYVDFATPEAKAAAVALSEHPLAGRKLLIKDGGDFQGRPIAPGVDVKTNDNDLAQKVHSKTAQRILKAQKQPPAPTLFVGNLPFETTEDDIRKLLETHRAPPKSAKKDGKEENAEKEEESGKEDEEGEDLENKKQTSKPKSGQKDDVILKIRMGTFEDTGACKGFTFVDFSSIDNATSALINPRNHRFNGRELKVEYAAAAGSKLSKKSDGKARLSKPKPLNGDRNQTLEVNDDEDAMQVVEEPQEKKAKPRPGFKDSERDGRRGSKARPKPGAALALAKRETAAIVQSQGKKTTF